MEWESDLYDFSDPEVRLKYVPQLGCNVGGAMSMLRKSWKSYKAARREGYEDRCLELEHMEAALQNMNMVVKINPHDNDAQDLRELLIQFFNHKYLMCESLV